MYEYEMKSCTVGLMGEAILKNSKLACLPATIFFFLKGKKYLIRLILFFQQFNFANFLQKCLFSLLLLVERVTELNINTWFCTIFNCLLCKSSFWCSLDYHIPEDRLNNEYYFLRKSCRSSSMSVRTECKMLTVLLSIYNLHFFLWRIIFFSFFTAS